MSSPTPAYDIGDSRRFFAQFTNVDEQAQDPSTVKATVTMPNGAQFLYEIADEELNRVDEGYFSLDFTFTTKGRHQIRFIGEGDVISAEMVEVFIRG